MSVPQRYKGLWHQLIVLANLSAEKVGLESAQMFAD